MSATIRSKRKWRACVWSVRLTQLLSLLLAIFTLQAQRSRANVRRRSANQAQYSLYIAYVTSHISGGAKVQGLYEVGLQSLLDVLQLPSPDVDVRLGYYLQCSSKRNRTAQTPDVFDLSIDDSQLDLNTLSGIMKRFAHIFNTSNAYCSSKLSHAVCHAQQQLESFTTSTHEPFFFLMEHDWILLPSQVQLTPEHFMKLSSAHNIQYILFDRGDRRYGGRRTHFLHSPRLYDATEYANNPFICTKNFLAHLGKELEMCSEHIESERWELEVSERIFRDGRSSEMSILAPRYGKTTMYHWDGRFFFLMQNLASGPVTVLNTALKSKCFDPRSVVKQIDIFCRGYSEECRPYFLRYIFIRILNNYKNKHQILDCNTDQLISRVFSMSRGETSFFTKGYLPQQICDA